MLRAVASQTSGGSPGNFTTLTVTGVASFADGTAAAPSITFTSDTNTGIYKVADNTGGLTADGVLSFFWGSTFASVAGDFFAYGTSYFGGVAGAESLRVSTVASAVNQVHISGAITGSPVSIAATGTDANIGITLTPKGTGKLRIDTAPAAIGVTVATDKVEVNLNGTAYYLLCAPV